MGTLGINHSSFKKGKNAAYGGARGFHKHAKWMFFRRNCILLIFTYWHLHLLLVFALCPGLCPVQRSCYLCYMIQAANERSCNLKLSLRCVLLLWSENKKLLRLKSRNCFTEKKTGVLSPTSYQTLGLHRLTLSTSEEQPTVLWEGLMKFLSSVLKHSVCWMMWICGYLLLCSSTHFPLDT